MFKSNAPNAEINYNSPLYPNLSKHSAAFLVDPPTLMLIFPIFELSIKDSKFLSFKGFNWLITSIAAPPIIETFFGRYF